MFDVNQFKKGVKEWVRLHPSATVADFTDFCEEMIPPSHYAANQWLIDQSISWYRFVKTQRDKHITYAAEEEE